MLIKEIVLHNPSSEHFMLASNPGCTHVEPWWNRSARAASKSLQAKQSFSEMANDIKQATEEDEQCFF